MVLQFEGTCGGVGLVAIDIAMASGANYLDMVMHENAIVH